MALFSYTFDGAANKALLEYILEIFFLERSDVELIRGEQSRSKQLKTSEAAIRTSDRLATILDSGSNWLNFNS